MVVPGAIPAAKALPWLLSVSELTAPSATVEILIVPALASVRFCAPLIPPMRLSVVPASAPIVAALPSVIAPLTVLLPLEFSRAPAAETPALLRFRALVNVVLAAGLNCIAAPALLATVIVPVPSAAVLVTCTMPALIVMPPVQEPFTVLFSTSVPLSFL